MVVGEYQIIVMVVVSSKPVLLLVLKESPDRRTGINGNNAFLHKTVALFWIANTRIADTRA